MKNLFILSIILILSSCTDKKEIVKELSKNPNNTIDEYIKELGEPIYSYTSINDNIKPTVKRRWYRFLLEESSSDCNVELKEGKQVLDQIVEISFEPPLKIEFGCMRNPKELIKVREEILNCV